MADVRLDGWKIGFRRVPGPHLSRGPNGIFLVEDWRQACSVLLVNAPHQMLNNQVDVQGDKDSAAQRVRVKE